MSDPATCRNCQTDKEVVDITIRHPKSAHQHHFNPKYTGRNYCWDCLDAILNQYWHQLAANLRPPREKVG